MEENYKISDEQIRFRTLSNKEIVMSLDNIISMGTVENPKKMLYLLAIPIGGIIFGLLFSAALGSNYPFFIFVMGIIYSIYFGQKKIPQKVLKIESSGGVSYLIMINNSDIFEEIGKIEKAKKLLQNNKVQV